jgi:hypothetical protein
MMWIITFDRLRFARRGLLVAALCVVAALGGAVAALALSDGTLSAKLATRGISPTTTVSASASDVTTVTGVTNSGPKLPQGMTTITFPASDATTIPSASNQP